MTTKNECIGAVDFGAREIRAVVAQQKIDGAIQILGHGSAPGQGCVYQGVIQDLPAAQSALRQAIDQAAKAAHEDVDAVYCGINGRNVETFIREEKIQLEQEIVDQAHLDEAIELASRDVAELGKRIISSSTAQEWYVDDIRVGDPVGIRGHVLKARIHFARMPSIVEKNIQSCVQSQRLRLEDIVFLPLATSLGCLTPEDKELGIAVLNIGRGTTGLTVHRDCRILGAHCFDWGGYIISRDVSAGLQISFEEADELILEYGIAKNLLPATAGNNGNGSMGNGSNGHAIDGESHKSEIKLKSNVHGSPTIVSRAKLEEIVHDRANELLTQVRQHLHSRGFAKHLLRGVVVTGGGAHIKRICQLGEAVFQVPCRVGLPVSAEILPQAARTPEFTAVIGIARHGFHHRNANHRHGNGARVRIAQGAKVLTGAFRRYFF